MPQLTDRNRIRAILNQDRIWAAYALADLAPGYAEHCTWIAAARDEAIALVYFAFAIPVVILVGEAPNLLPVLAELSPLLARQREIYFVIRPDILPILEPDFEVKDLRPEVRMVLFLERFAPNLDGHAERLGRADLEAVTALFADGNASGESPEFFLPEMLEHGVYYGVREAGDLVAVAGTHVLAPAEGVGGLGNIYTRSDRRGRGLGACVTGAVVSELLRRNFPTIVLNVRKANSTAIRLYERLGFHAYCEYYEAIAVPRKRRKVEEPIR